MHRHSGCNEDCNTPSTIEYNLFDETLVSLFTEYACHLCEDITPTLPPSEKMWCKFPEVQVPYDIIYFMLFSFDKSQLPPQKKVFDMLKPQWYPCRDKATYRGWLNLPFSQVQRSLQVVPTALRGTNPAVAPTVTPGALPAMAFGSAMLGNLDDTALKSKI